MTTHKVPLPHTAFSVLGKWLPSKQDGCLLQIQTSFIVSEKKSKLFSKKQRSDATHCLFWFISHTQFQGKISEKLHLRVVEWRGACRVLFVGAECKYSCASLTQIKLNKSPWVVSTKWSGKPVVTLLIWWMLTTNTDNFFSK